MIYLDLDLDLDLDLNEVIKIFICLVFNLNLSTFNSLSPIELSTYLARTYILQYQHPALFAQVYNYVTQVYNQVGLRDDQLFSIQNPDPSAAGPSNFALGVPVPSTCRQNAIMGNNALDPNAIPSTSSGLGALASSAAGPSTANFNVPDLNTLIASSAAGSSTAALYTPVASISGSKMSRKRKHANEKQFECTYEGCNKKFPRVNHLNDHINTHENKRPHKCPVCGRGFNAPNALYYHINTHGNKRPHKCPDCSRGFNSPNALYYHINTHGNKRPHKCPVCGRGFNALSNLNSHINTHGNKKPHQCPDCSRGFNSPSALYYHKRSKHKDD